VEDLKGRAGGGGGKKTIYGGTVIKGRKDFEPYCHWKGGKMEGERVLRGRYERGWECINP